MWQRLYHWLFPPTVLAEPRSPHWPKVRRDWLAAHPTCAACGSSKHLQVHHILPFAWPGGKERELDTANLITLCESPSHNCHLWVGHLGDFRSRNPHVRDDAMLWLAKIQQRPYPPGVAP